MIIEMIIEMTKRRGFMSSGTETHTKQRPFLYQLNLAG